MTIYYQDGGVHHIPIIRVIRCTRKGWYRYLYVEDKDWPIIIDDDNKVIEDNNFKEVICPF